MRRLTALCAVAGAFAVVPAGATAQEGVSGWDGKNPFDCTLQQLERGVEFPQPDADPFCVEYEKRNQNVTELGVVQFLSLEPARVAAASPKCFYFQHDHWVGSVVQGNPATQTYAWDGSYFFDKAKGSGGVYVENFSFNGQSGDPTLLPGFPEEYKPHFGQGRGGVQRTGAVDVDPRCAAKAGEQPPYREPEPEGTGPGGGFQGADRCRVPGGRVNRGIGGVRLGMKRASARQKLGQPTTEASKYMTWCMTGGGRIAAAFGAKGDGARAVLIVTNADPFDSNGIRRGTKSSKARRKLKRERTIAKGVLAVRRKRDVLIVGLAKGRVVYLASASRKISSKRAVRFLAKAPG